MGKKKKLRGMPTKEGRFDLEEDRMIAQAKRAFSGLKAANLELGPGDDCAAFFSSEGKLTLLSVDALVEGTHFRMKRQTAAELGFKAVAVTVSDVAAMGGKPRFLFISAALGPDLPRGFYDGLLGGMRKACERWGVVVGGGDLVRSPSLTSLSLTVVGESERERLKTRGGARPGDLLMMTGRPGLSFLGWRLLEKGLQPATKLERECVRKHRTPEARVEQGLVLGKSRWVRAMMDLSDGLAQDAGRMAAASGVGFVLHEASLPADRAFSGLCKKLGRVSVEAMLQGGEDYELLFAVEPRGAKTVRAAVERTGVSCIVLGEAVETAPGLWLRDAGGGLWEIRPSGFAHFQVGRPK